MKRFSNTALLGIGAVGVVGFLMWRASQAQAAPGGGQQQLPGTTQQQPAQRQIGYGTVANNLVGDVFGGGRGAGGGGAGGGIQRQPAYDFNTGALTPYNISNPDQTRSGNTKVNYGGYNTQSPSYTPYG